MGDSSRKLFNPMPICRDALQYAVCLQANNLLSLDARNSVNSHFQLGTTCNPEICRKEENNSVRSVLNAISWRSSFHWPQILGAAARPARSPKIIVRCMFPTYLNKYQFYCSMEIGVFEICRTGAIFWREAFIYVKGVVLEKSKDTFLVRG
jgi:hypothetical protein